MQKRAYLDLLGESGCVPLPLPPVAPAQLQVLYGFCDGIFLPGGRDVGPDLYGEPPLMPAGDEFQPELDRAELAITRWAARDRLPVLAVCRGVQMLNVAAGGTLWQDLPTQKGLPGHGGGPADITTEHDVAIDEETRLADIFGVGRLRVNSRHHQAVRFLGAGLRVSAQSDDGVIEAIESESDWYALAVQWHPEDLRAPGHAAALFGAFAAVARESAAAGTGQGR
jgi:putative glutamine amidotransferase